VIGTLAGSFALALLLFAFPEYFDLAMARFADEGVATARYQMWMKTLEILTTNPLGLGIHHEGYSRAMQQFGFHYSTPHNIYLGLAVNTGVPGLIAFLTIAGGCLRRVQLARLLGDQRLRTVATAIMVVLLGFLVSGLSEPIFRNDFKLQHLFFLFAGIGSYLPAWVVVQNRSAPGTDQTSEVDPLTGVVGDSSLQPWNRELS
jgi:O-antigen ligase